MTNSVTLDSLEFDKKYDIIDSHTPRHALMTGRYKRSYAYYTLRERLPVILTGVIDNLTKEKDELAQRFGEDSREELKTVVGQLSKLKYQLQTDKQLEKFNGNEPDKEEWNTFLSGLSSKSRSFFTACWLYAECYMYRRISSFFEAAKTLNTYDYFAKQKQNALTGNLTTLEYIADYIPHATKDFTTFEKFLKLNLWGNRCDLSLSVGKEIKQTDNQIDLINSFNSKVLIDQSTDIWNCLCAAPADDPTIIDYICDNAGYELYTDFVLADFLITHNLAKKIRFNVKAIPWFISDVTENDFNWMLKYLRENKSKSLSELGTKWSKYVNEGQFELAPKEYFWTSAYEFYHMRNIKPELYKRLSEARLVIFKGDLNYRKLLSDYTWDCSEEFVTCLRGFQPSSLCALRTVKADLICGISEEVAESLTKKQADWMITGEYGVIQFVGRDNCDCSPDAIDAKKL